MHNTSIFSRCQALSTPQLPRLGWKEWWPAQKIVKNLQCISVLQHPYPYCFLPTFFCDKDNATNKCGSDFSRLRSIHRTDNLETSAQKVTFRSTDDIQDSLSIKKTKKRVAVMVHLRSGCHLHVKELLKILKD